jgi:hypothetical protein
MLTLHPALSGAAEDPAERNRPHRLARRSLTAYEARADPPNRLLRLALGTATKPGSAWTRIARYVDDRMETTSR